MVLVNEKSVDRVPGGRREESVLLCLSDYSAYLTLMVAGPLPLARTGDVHDRAAWNWWMHLLYR